MASIRRTLSPAYHDRSYQNGGISLSVNSTSQKLFSNSKNSSTTSFPSAFLALTFAFRRKGNQQWRRLILRWFIFFVVGFLVGITPFGHVDEDDFVRNQYFLVDVTPPHFNARIEENDTRLDVVGGDGGLNRRDFVGGVRFEVGEEQKVEYVPRKQLIVVTPTYKRAMQSYFLNRMGQLLKLVPQPVLWIVVEMNSASMETAEILRKTGVMYRHLVCSKNSTDVKDRGVRQRNVALQHIELHKLDGIVYFADDDNIFSLELFDRLRNIRYAFLPFLNAL